MVKKVAVKGTSRSPKKGGGGASLIPKLACNLGGFTEARRRGKRKGSGGCRCRNSLIPRKGGSEQGNNNHSRGEKNRAE